MLLRFIFIFIASPIALANATVFSTCDWRLKAAVNDLTSKIQTPAQQVAPVDSPLTQSLRRIRERASQMNFDAVDTIFYPFAGFDSFTPAMLFPNAKTIVTLDMQPFASKTNKASEFVATPYFGKSGFEHIFTVMSKPQISVAIVSGLLGAFPGVRILSVLEFRMKNFEGKETSNGVIEYDLGPGTPKRQYIHLHGWVGYHKRDLANSWFESLDHMKIDAVIVKGAMGFFNDFLSMRNGIEEVKFGQIFFRDAIETWLSRSRGMLVTAGNHKENQEKTPLEFSIGVPAENISTRIDIPNVEFGYGNKVTILRY